MVPPPDDTPDSLGDGVTGSDVDSAEDSSAQSLGDQSTTGDMGSSISDLDALVGDFEDGHGEIIDLEARYEIGNTLGKGGMGEVVLARDKRLNRQVAIKRLKEELGANRKAAQRFLTEAQSVAALSHFNIVQIHDYGQADDGPFIVMEYVGGGSLAETLEGGALERERTIELGCQLCEAIGVAHQAGIIHRDIKPANVLMTAEGVPKLTDFGLARQETVDGGQTQAGAVLGTLDFMPPEQKVDATQTDARSDLWSLGATLYQMLTGEIPRVIDLDLAPAGLRNVLGTVLKSKPEDRYQSAAEFREALKSAGKDGRAVLSDLGEGQCPSCGTKNESSRKFCRECATELQVNCLSCGESILVWDKVCGECGGKQSELAALKLEELASQRDQAEEHRRGYLFENALQIAHSLSAVEDERFAKYVPWAKEFVNATEAEWERERESAVTHFAEARKHRDTFDYASAIHAVESIPEAMRTSEVSGYLQQLERDRAESEELIKTISARVKRRDLKGLLEQVERAVELRGDRTDLQEQAGQLREREEKRRQQRDEACNEATRLLGTGDAKGALMMIQSVPADDLRSSDEPLRRQLEEIVAAEDQLTALVQKSKADGVLDPDEVVSIWQATVSCLALNPHHETIPRIQQKLEGRIQKAVGKYAAFGELADFWPTQPANVLLQLPPRKNSIGMQFKLLPGGTFTMGGEAAPHKVTLTKPFELGVYEVTQEQYQQVMGINPSRYKGPQNPVETVSWSDAVEFCRKLSGLPSEKSGGYGYRLPTEAEWAYACRAGTTTRFSFGDSESELDAYAWYQDNSGHTTDPVGGKKPNSWGLYDMHGNVCEWCQDRFGPYSGLATDPTGSPGGSYRVVRGGNWDSIARLCRSADRSGRAPEDRDDDLGFRVVRSSIK